MYALAVRVIVLKGLHGADTRRYCHEINQYVRFLLDVQFRWQSGLRRKPRLTPYELQIWGGFREVPFAAGAIDVYTGNYHLIDVDADGINLSNALGFPWVDPATTVGGGLLNPDDVAQNITFDDIENRFLESYAGILAKQGDFSFTRLRFLTGLQEFSDTAKSLGAMCAGPRSSRLIERYRQVLRTARQQTDNMRAGGEHERRCGELARALGYFASPPESRATGEDMARVFEIYCALQPKGSSLLGELIAVVNSQGNKAAE
jgi:hypothetical protein